MTGWNLPPGCNASDIPNNRPEDEAWEKLEQAFWSDDKNCTEELWNEFEKAELDSGLMNIVAKAIEFGIETGRREQHLIEEENRYYEDRAKERGEDVDPASK